MTKSLLSAAVVTAGLIAVPGVQAALGTNAVLEFGPQTFTCPYGLGTPPACVAGNPVPQSNYFAMDLDGSGVLEEDERVTLYAGTDLGVKIGADQTGFGTSTGSAGTLVITAPGQIDSGWSFLGDAGWHTANNIGITGGDDGTGDDIATLDMSSWAIHWNGIDIPLGASPLFASDTGKATLVCNAGSECGVGSSFTLDYSTHIPPGSVFDDAIYGLHLTGVIGEINAVPVPAAAWLFGSGLLGLIGVARRKTA